MSIFSWVLTAVSLVAVVLNIRKRAICFVLWTFTNGAWAWIDLRKDLIAQAVLQGVYLGLSLYGWWTWGRGVSRSERRRGEDEKPSAA